MKQYKIVKIRWIAKDTENMLNALAQEGWEFITAYGYEREHFLLSKNNKKQK